MTRWQANHLYNGALAGLLGLALAIPAGCYKGSDDGSDGADAGEDGGSAPQNGGVGISGMRRLSRNEYDNTVRDLLGDDTRPAATRLPEDVVDPFDNDYTTQSASGVLIEGLEALAIDIAQRFVADATRRDDVVGCTPTGPSDADCLRSFIETFGRRALRRPPTPAEVDAWASMAQGFAASQNDFYEGVSVVVMTLLQHPEFVYRVEMGLPTDDPNVFRLGDHEVATRLSYFLWGSTPDDELLDLAEAGGLGTPDDVVDAAARMLDDDRARERIDRFHAMWLGYHQLPHDPALTTALREETRALVDKVVFEDGGSWLELFRATGTFANDTLADHYGLSRPGSTTPQWVEYGDTGRQGILSHGSFLSVGAKFDDTSPTQRGIAIRTRLMCQSIPPPPPNVDADSPPESPDSNCKWDRYAAHRQNGACKSCHELTDPVGFGLERFDREGRFRTTDDDDSSCAIEGVGSVDGASFEGPAGLADVLIDSEVLDACAVSQVYRFAMGHEPQADDMRYVDELQTEFRDGGYLFDRLILRLVGDEAFGFRREGEE